MRLRGRYAGAFVFQDLGQSVVQEIFSAFQITSQDVSTFLGIEIKLFPDGSLFMHQSAYVQSIFEQFNITDSKPQFVLVQPGLDLKPAPNADESKPYCQLIGALLFLTRVSRPDICFAVSKMSCVIR